MNILSIFITSTKVYLSLNTKSKVKTYDFSFYPSFQSSSDLEFLISKFVESVSLSLEDVNILPISTIYELKVFGKTTRFLTEELEAFQDFTYVYFDNLTFYSLENISAASLGLSKRSDNFISNRSVYASAEFTGDVEEIVYLSKSMTKNLKSLHRKVVIGGDYFSNIEIPNEYKMNLLSEILGSGFYEIYFDTQNVFPNYLNLKNSTSFEYKLPEFEKFIYLITSEKRLQLLLKKEGSSKYLEVSDEETFFLHFNELENIQLDYKGRDISKGSLLLDSDFAGVFVDRRSFASKKENLGIESFRRVLNSIDRNNDYSSI